MAPQLKPSPSSPSITKQICLLMRNFITKKFFSLKLATSIVLVALTFVTLSNVATSAPSSFSNLQLTELVIDNKYKLTSHIKTGGFGSVYAGIDMQTKTPVAVKIETVSVGSKLKNEYDVLMKMQGTAGFPHVHCYREDIPTPSSFQRSSHQALVMQRLGSPIRSIIRNSSSTSSSSLPHKMQALYRIEDLHNKGILHLDIKPNNFLLGADSGNSNSTDVYLIDFGLSIPYMKHNVHTIYSDGHNHLGTPGLRSLHSMLGEAQSRRDDLEALGYTLLSLYPDHQLPWAHISTKVVSKQQAEAEEAILAVMIQTKLTDLCSGAPVEFLSFFRHVKALGFYEKPNYEYLRKLFVSFFERKYGSFENAGFVYT